MYKITIEQTKKETQLKGGDWVRLDNEEVEREKSMYDMVDKNEPKTRIKEIYGYSPQIEKQVIVESVVYTQLVEELDLNKVIIAVNGIKEK